MMTNRYNQIEQAKILVFSVNLVCKKELNLMLKVSETSSQGAVGFELRGTDYIIVLWFCWLQGEEGPQIIGRLATTFEVQQPRLLFNQ